MKNILFLLIILLSCVGFRNLEAQTVLKNTISSPEGDYTLEMLKDIDGFYTFTLKDTKTDSTAQFSIKPMMKTSFINGFVASRLKLIPKEILRQKSDAQQLPELINRTEEEAATQFFNVLIANLEPDQSEPVAGKLSIIDTIPVLRLPTGTPFAKRMIGKKSKNEKISNKKWRKRLSDKRWEYEKWEEQNNPDSLIKARNEYLQELKDAAESRNLKELKFQKVLDLIMEQSEEDLVKKHLEVQKYKAQMLYQQGQKQAVSHAQKLCQDNFLAAESQHETLVSRRIANTQNLINQRVALRTEMGKLDSINANSTLKSAQLQNARERLGFLEQDSARLATDFFLSDSARSIRSAEVAGSIYKQRETTLQLEAALRMLTVQNGLSLQNIDFIQKSLNHLTGDSTEIEKRIADEATKKDEWQRLTMIEKVRRDSLDTVIDSINLRMKSAEQAEQLAYTSRPKRDMAVEYVQLEFHDGYIENIVVFGHLVDAVNEKLKFENIYPIGFSTKKNFEQLEIISLYDNKLDVSYRMKLGNLLAMYEQNHSLLSKDYSPKNQVITVRPPDKNLTLTKEPTNKLLEAQVFTDLIGFGELNPNGLVQTHITRKIPLRTRRFSLFDYRQINFGYLNYVEPTVVFSKFEEKIRYLNVNSLDFVINNTLFSRKYTSTIRTKEYENFSTGLDLNIGLLDFPNFKSTTFFDFGFRYGHTAVQDSIRILSQGVIQTSSQEPDKYVVKTYQLYPKFIWKIMPDERYGFFLSYQWNFFILRDNRVKQVGNEIEFRNGITSKHLNWFETFQLGGFFKPDKNSDNKFFFRYIFHHQHKHWNLNFDQAQLGYSFFISVARKSK